MSEIRLQDFWSVTYDKLRYGDTDMQGHINNAVYSSFFESGRVAIFDDAAAPLRKPGFSFVLAHIGIDYIAEVLWPGEVKIGTSVVKVGRCSVTFSQAVFQNGKLSARAESVVVQISLQTRRSTPLDETARARFATLVKPKVD